MIPGNDKLQKAKEESRTLDEELKKHRDKVLTLKNNTKKQIADMEADLEDTKQKLVRSVKSIVLKFSTKLFEVF